MFALENVNIIYFLSQIEHFIKSIRTGMACGFIFYQPLFHNLLTFLNVKVQAIDCTIYEGVRFVCLFDWGLTPYFMLFLSHDGVPALWVKKFNIEPLATTTDVVQRHHKQIGFMLPV